MQILTVTNTQLDPNLGSGKTVIRYCQGLKELGHQIVILEPKDYELGHGTRLAKRLRQSLGSWRQIIRKLHAQQFDLVEFYGAEFWPAILHISALKSRPLLVAHTNGLEMQHLQNELVYSNLKPRLSALMYNSLMRQAFIRTDNFVSLCQADRRYVVDHMFYDFEQTEVVEPGLDPEFLLSEQPTLAGRQDRIAYNGSWTTRKGVCNLVSVMSDLLSQNRQLYLDVYGSHQQKTMVLQSFPESVRGQITVHGQVSNQELANGLRQTKIFFFPSLYEGYGMAMAEAMACGCAVVTTPTGLGAELNDNSEALVCNYNDEQAMRDSIIRLLTDENLRHMIATNGWRRTRDLSWESNIKKLEQTYKKWLAIRQAIRN